MVLAGPVTASGKGHGEDSFPRSANGDAVQADGAAIQGGNLNIVDGSTFTVNGGIATLNGNIDVSSGGQYTVNHVSTTDPDLSGSRSYSIVRWRELRG